MDPREALMLGRRLLDAQGLHDWEIGLDRARRRAGCCRYRERRITLSAALTSLHPPEQVRDTILHEVAHALAGPRAGHGPTWQAWARAVGARPERCLPQDAPTLPGRWVGICPRGHQVDRHRRPTRVLSCRQCSRGFDPGAIFDWVEGDRPAELPASYRAELARITAGGNTAHRQGVRATMDLRAILPSGVTAPAPGSVLLLTTSWCGYCRRLKSQLDREGLPYTEVDIEETPAAVDVVETVNGGNRTVPTVIFPDGTAATNPSVADVRLRLA